MAAGGKLRRRRIAATMAVGLALVLLAILSSKQASNQSKASMVGEPTPAGTRPPHRAAPRTVKVAAPVSAPIQRGAPIPPVIDEITVEKEVVCEGEENLITVTAHTLDGADALLHATIGGERGMSVPVKTYLRDGKPLQPRIIVFGAKNVATVVDVPSYTVKPCKPERVVNIGLRAVPNREDEFEFFARVIASGKESTPFNAKRYLWNFGDGETQVTPSGLATHAYGHDGPRNALYSQRLIKVEVVGEGGDSISGRTSLQLMSAAYEHLLKFDVVALMSQGTPRFPTIDQRGVVRQKFEIWHQYGEPVEIQSVTVISQDKAGRRGGESKLDLATIIGETEIPVGKSIEAELSLDTAKHPDLVALVYRLEGTSADGKTAIGEVSVMVPPPKPTPENSNPVTDPKMVAKIQKALAILGQDTVTQEDIWRLEREGRL